MPKADTDHITAGPALPPSRRGLLAAAASALVAGAAIATAAHGAPVASPGLAGDDAELISLCDRLVAIMAEEARIFATIEDEGEQERALEPTSHEYRAIEARLYDLGNPTTPAGLRAAAAAAVATAPKNLEGEIECWSFGLAEWLAFSVVEMLAGRTAA
jgi:hypothetical protein